MKIPEEIKVRVICDGESDMSGVVVEVIVSTGKKNPYMIYFPKTDRSGVATLTRADFTGQFTDHWQESLMDHSGTLEDAQPVVRVGLYDLAPSLENRDVVMAWPLLKHERTKWSSRDEEYHYRTSSRNADFLLSPIMVDLEKTTDIVLRLQRKTLAT
jgi:hypothetical protein